MESAIKIFNVFKKLKILLFIISLLYSLFIIKASGAFILESELAGKLLWQLEEHGIIISYSDWLFHVVGSTSLLATILIWYFKYKDAINGILWILNNRSIDDSNSFYFSKSSSSEILIKFSHDARFLDLLAGRGDFIRQSDKQFQKLLDLGPRCRILINDRHGVPLSDLWALTRSGVKIRVYQEGKNKTLRGRIKHTDSGGNICIFDKSGDRYRLFLNSNQVIVSALTDMFDRWFSESRNALVKHILFDLGNVFLIGDFNDFLLKASVIAGSNTNLKSADYLCASEGLNLGKIDILDYFRETFGIINSSGVYKEIEKIWLETWTIDPEMQNLAQQITNSSITISVVSNCDLLNASKYELNGYLDYFEHRFLSCRIGLLKPTEGFFKFVLNALNCDPRECVIIDDHLDVISVARSLGMDTIHVSMRVEPKNRAAFVRDELKKRGLLQNYNH